MIRIEPREFVAGSSAAHAAIIGGLVMWIFLHFFPIGWPQLNAVYEHGLAWARSQAFYDQTLFWQWMRLPGDVVFSAGALIMGWDFIMKLRQPRGQLSEPGGRAAHVPAE